MDNQQMQQIRRWLEAALRRKTMIALFTLLGIAAGLAVYLTQPKIYRSSAMLSYEQQRINPSQMSPDVVARIRETVNTVSHIVLSRTSLEQIINSLGMADQSDKALSMEQQVERLRGRISFDLSRQGDTFTIAVFGTSPERTAEITNALASRFIEENLKYREGRAAETSLYTQDELTMAKEMLDRREEMMRDYKLKHFNEMPEQREGNLARLNSLQEQYQNRQNSIQDLERTRVLVQEQINVRRQLLAENARLRAAQAPTEPAAGVQPETDRERLTRLQATLQNLLTRYTEQHPQIRQMQREISALEHVVETSGSDEGTTAQTGRPSDGQFDQALFDLQIQLKDIGLNIQKLNQERTELLKAISQYEGWIAAVPAREAEWSALTREYGELRRHYDHLLAQDLQARSALNLERTQKGSQFKIEDPARVAEKPIKPIFAKIMLFGLLAGAGLGALLAFGLEALDASFRNPNDVEAALDLEVLCPIPYLPLKREVRVKRYQGVAKATFFVLFCAGIVAVVVMKWNEGVIIL